MTHLDQRIQELIRRGVQARTVSLDDFNRYYAPAPVVRCACGAQAHTYDAKHRPVCGACAVAERGL